SSSIYIISLHDALPISVPPESSRLDRTFHQAADDLAAEQDENNEQREYRGGGAGEQHHVVGAVRLVERRDRCLDHRVLRDQHDQDRKSTRLNSSHVKIS